MYSKMKKRGITPVVATTLLIVVVFILALIIFLWARGFVSEKIEKFGSAAELSCDNIAMEAVIYESDVDIINRGNVPIYGVVIKIVGKGEVLVRDVPGSTIGLGESFSVTIASLFLPAGTTELNVVPIILGESDSGKVAYTCPDQFGYPVSYP
jgi:flagellin-like protein